MPPWPVPWEQPWAPPSVRPRRPSEPAPRRGRRSPPARGRGPTSWRWYCVAWATVLLDPLTVFAGDPDPSVRTGAKLYQKDEILAMPGWARLTAARAEPDSWAACPSKMTLGRDRDHWNAVCSLENNVSTRP